MTDETLPPSSNSSDPMDAVRALVEVLQRDLEQRTSQLERLNAMLESRNQMLLEQVQRRDDSLREEIAAQREMEHARTNRTAWYSGLAGLVAVIGGLILAYLVFRLAYDMNRMEDYMYNMGHSMNDDRPFYASERKHKGPSYMFNMSSDMGGMREDMAAMRSAMTTMTGSMTAMSADMGQMRTDMAGMRGDIGTMSGDMSTMNTTMGLLRQDTANITWGVGSMSHDTRSMGAPFRMMDSFIPW